MSVEHQGILYISQPDLNEDPDSHQRRAWMIVRSLSPMTTEDVTSDVLNQVEHLSRIWYCIKFMGCTYDPIIFDRIETFLKDIPDVWGRSAMIDRSISLAKHAIRSHPHPLHPGLIHNNNNNNKPAAASTLQPSPPSASAVIHRDNPHTRNRTFNSGGKYSAHSMGQTGCTSRAERGGTGRRGSGRGRGRERGRGRGSAGIM